jgi:hypothetical protein
MSPADRVHGWVASELMAAAAIVLAAAVLRFWSPGSMGIEHYDEGVYVISALGLSDPGLQHRIFPHQIYFSPPLYFGLVSLAHSIFGGALDRVAVMVNAFFGTLTVGLIWWIGRGWFGPAAGLAAAALLALSDFHIALSRSALTDVAFAFFLLLAVGLIVSAFERDSLLMAACAGLSTGLAWNAKYHGWIAPALGMIAWLPFIWWRAQPVNWRRALGAWATIAAIALAAYLPWVVYIQRQPGGYAGLTRWQASFLQTDWLEILARHAPQQSFLDGHLSDLSVPIAAALALVASSTRRLRAGAAAVLGAIALSCWLAEGWIVMLLVAVAGVAQIGSYADRLAAWLACAWLVIFVALTPFYHPYARLFLPITLIGCLLAGLALSSLARWGRSPEGGVAGAAVWSLLAAAVIGALSGATGRADSPLRSARGAADASSAMAALMPLGSRVKVIEEPPVAYYLYRLGFDTLRNVHDKEIPANESRPIYVVTGFYGNAGIDRLGDRVKLLGRFPMRPKDLRLLDDLNPPYPSKPPDAAAGRHDLFLFLLAPTSQRG